MTIIASLLIELFTFVYTHTHAVYVSFLNVLVSYAGQANLSLQNSLEVTRNLPHTRCNRIIFPASPPETLLSSADLSNSISFGAQCCALQAAAVRLSCGVEPNRSGLKEAY